VKGNLKGETTTFHPASRFCKGFEAPGGRWKQHRNIAWRSDKIVKKINDLKIQNDRLIYTNPLSDTI
jgi:hypothetical protein